ncbi:MAG TPA: hypothetical protein VF533_10790 [Solirubrobacteraceae bacterium]|jgi:Ca2+-binding RTX toxin-like protein
MRRPLLAVLAALALPLLLPAAGQATNVSVIPVSSDVSSEITYVPLVKEGTDDDSGTPEPEVNTVFISRPSPRRIVVTDQTAPVTPGRLCEAVSSHTARCDIPADDPEVKRTMLPGYVTLGMFDDRLTLGSYPFEVDAGAGADTIRGGAAPARIFGGEGDDTLQAGTGDDTLSGGPGTDLLDGGDGRDSISYSGSPGAVAVTLDGQRNDGLDPDHSGISGPSEENDRDVDVEDVTGSGGADRLVGNDGPNALQGLSGDDLLRGRLGADALDGEQGMDTLDGGIGNDRLDGGVGADLLDGGPGLDFITYARRGANDPVAIRLDGARNDGSDPDRNGVSEPDEEGDQDVSIENATGGPGRDFILSLLSGRNLLNGLAGDDRIYSRDGSATTDYISCGTGADKAQTDPADSKTSCETALP